MRQSTVVGADFQHVSTRPKSLASIIFNKTSRLRPACTGRTDRRTDYDSQDRASIAVSCGKNAINVQF